MIIRSFDVHEDVGRAKFGVLLAAKELGIECNCKLSSQWIVKIDGNEREAFLELAREAAERV
jgi:hypothetical protein